jgi:hypothetical protein
MTEWPKEIDMIVPEPPVFDFLKYMAEVIFYSMAIPYPMMSDESYEEWIQWMIQTGQLR